MKRILFSVILLFNSHSQTFGQNLALTFQEAQDRNILIKDLDSIYRSAIHADTSLAVFKTEKEQEEMITAYTTLLQDLGKFLSSRDFKWTRPTRCFNRIYFNSDGTIDYFLFNFSGKAEDRPSPEIQKEFTTLLHLFIRDYQLPITTETKYAQCSPTVYMPEN